MSGFNIRNGMGRQQTSMDYICRTYSVPAKVGGRVEYTGGAEPRQGQITGAEGAHLLVRLDGEKYSHVYHPTWKLRYLDGEPST